MVAVGFNPRSANRHRRIVAGLNRIPISQTLRAFTPQNLRGVARVRASGNVRRTRIERLKLNTNYEQLRQLFYSGLRLPGSREIIAPPPRISAAPRKYGIEVDISNSGMPMDGPRMRASEDKL